MTLDYCENCKCEFIRVGHENNLCSDCNPLLIKSLELHKDPRSLCVWGVSFIYDDIGDEGDVIFTGTREEMRVIYNKYKDMLKDVEYFDALAMIADNGDR